MKINQNITKYLDSYLAKDDTQYAILLTGKWGCGKTYFIKEYMRKYQDRLIYVSLFGLKNIDGVNDAIFSSMYPKLTSDTTKIATGLLKSVAKIGLQFDLDELNLKDKMVDFLTKNKDKYIFVFDDLERSFIPYDEILGFINGFTEHNSLKIILVANVDEIKGENKEIFDKFKEKVVNRTFVVQNNYDSFWEIYYDKYPEFNDCSSKILKIFQDYAENNFRLLMQASEDYLYFVEYFKNTEFFENNDFKKEFLGYFLSFCIFYKKSNDFNKLKEEFHKGKYDVFFTKYILPMNIWEDILVKNKIEVDKIVEIFSGLFIFKPPQEQPSWVKLWYYWDITPNKFYENLSDMQSKFKNLEYDRIDVLEHVYSLLILFTKNGLVQDLTINEIFDIVENYIEKNKNNPDWLKHKLGDEFSNNTGLGFTNKNDEDVIRLKNMIKEKINKQKEYIEEQCIDEYLENILTTIKNGDFDTLYDLFMENETKPIINKINNQELYNILKEYPENIHILSRALYSRYSIDYTIGGIARAKWLVEEKDFVKNLIIFLRELEQDEDLDKFYAFRIGIVISSLNDDILPRFDN